MIAEKDNKVYSITKEEKKRYKDLGYDIRDEEGNILEYGKGKTVSVEKYEAMKDELKKAKAELEAEKKESEKQDDEMTKKVLTAFACEHGIDIGKAASVAGIMKKIEAAKPELANGAEKDEEAKEE